MFRLACFALLLSIPGTIFAAGEPWRRHTIDGSSRGADGVRLADVNGDGLADIATGWEEGGVVRAYVNPGPKEASRPWPAVTVGSVKSPEDAVFADLDGDGATDVVSSTEGKSRTLYAHWAPPDPADYLTAQSWKTEPFLQLAGKEMWMFCLPLDVDGRRGIDLVVGSKGDGASIGWLESPADPRDLAAWKYHRLHDAGWIMSLRARDMDGDGDLDVLASDRKGKGRGVLWLEHPGVEAARAGKAWREHRIGAADREAMFLTTADLDGDRRTDIACASKDRGLSLFFAPADREEPWQHVQVPLPAGCGTGKGVAAGDLDGDGRIDLVFSCENATGDKSGVRWLAYDKSPREAAWHDREISGPEGIKFDRLELLDLDRDGDLDVLCCEERAGLGVVWYENPR
jgi:hypothetical protein